MPTSGKGGADDTRGGDKSGSAAKRPAAAPATAASGAKRPAAAPATAAGGAVLDKAAAKKPKGSGMAKAATLPPVQVDDEQRKLMAKIVFAVHGWPLTEADVPGRSRELPSVEFAQKVQRALCAKASGGLETFAAVHDTIVQALRTTFKSESAQELVKQGALDLSWWLANRKIASGVCANAFKERGGLGGDDDDNASAVALAAAEAAAASSDKTKQVYVAALKEVGQAIAAPHVVRAATSSIVRVHHVSYDASRG